MATQPTPAPAPAPAPTLTAAPHLALLRCPCSLSLPLEELRAISAKCFGLYECGQLASIFSCNYRSPVARLIDFDAGQRQPSELNRPTPPPLPTAASPPCPSWHVLHPCCRRQQQLVCAVRDAAAFCRSAKTIRACSPGSKSCCSREAALPPPPPSLPYNPFYSPTSRGFFDFCCVCRVINCCQLFLLDSLVAASSDC